MDSAQQILLDTQYRRSQKETLTIKTFSHNPACIRILTSHLVLYCVKRSLRSVVLLSYSLRHVVHAHTHIF